MWRLNSISLIGFFYLPILIWAVEDTACPSPWPTPETGRRRESCSCQTAESYGLQVKCSWIYEWPASTPLNTGELLLDGTRANTSLESYALAHFAPQLQVFSCENCGLINIEQMAFFGLNSLRKLSLKDNQLTTVKSFAFSGLMNLQELNLMNCGIVTLEKSAFFGLKNIEYFDLSQNFLYTIQIHAFKNVSSIRQMALNQIKTERLRGYSLQGLKDIGLLSFTHSEIRKIEAYAFYGVNNVTTINFHSSQVRDVMPYAFVGIGRVSSIKLKSTEVSSLMCESLEGLDCVRSIDWTGSPFRCDCNIQWMVEMSVNISRDLTKGMMCASPQQVRDKIPFNLEKDELNCNDEERYMGCARLDTRVPRVRALERYIEDVYAGPSISSATTGVYSLGLYLFSTLFFIIH